MKIYWTMKSISELKNLPPGLRKRNYRKAAKLASTHKGYRIGSVVLFLAVIFSPVLFKMAFPLLNTYVRDAFCELVIILPSLLVLNQYLYCTMRKHYRHILMKAE